jgi:hypothetical protein
MNAAIYQEAIANGCTERLAEMLACRKAPGGVTDVALLAGFNNGDETPKLRARAKQNYGFTPGPSDVYVPSMNPYGTLPGHPAAWLPPGNARGHVKKVCEKMGAGCEAVKVQRREVEPPKPVKLADSIVKRLVKQKVKQNPALALKPVQELKAMVIDQHGPKS